MSGPARDVFEQYENSPLAPWNEPEDVLVCKSCDGPMLDDDEYHDMCDKCVKEEDGHEYEAAAKADALTDDEKWSEVQ